MSVLVSFEIVSKKIQDSMIRMVKFVRSEESVIIRKGFSLKGKGNGKVKIVSVGMGGLGIVCLSGGDDEYKVSKLMKLSEDGGESKGRWSGYGGKGRVENGGQCGGL